MSVVELSGEPDLLPLFGKAALAGIRRGSSSRADSLPDKEFARSGVRVDRERLAAYDRVCGFRVSDELPLSYPHLLAFPLQAKLMTEPDFPFPMVGLVHIANRISRTRPLRADEPLVVRVAAANLRPHDRGVQFDLRSTVLADGEPVWTDVSTYLRRNGSSGSSGSGGSGARPDEPELGEPTAVWRVPKDIGRRYAAVSGDHNPIHLHPLTARLFGFPRAIAHGMWSKARCLAYFEGRLPDACTIDVKFKLPILLPATVALRVSGSDFTLTGARNGKPHLTGTLTG